jgi:hypothetical protein
MPAGWIASVHVTFRLARWLCLQNQRPSGLILHELFAVRVLFGGTEVISAARGVGRGRHPSYI